MTKQIDELMDLVADKFQATEYNSHSTLRTALEAALKPGEPAFYIIEPELEKLKKDGTRAVTLYTEPVTNGLDVPVYTAAPPAQTPPPRLTDKGIKYLIPDGEGWKYEVGFDEATEFARAIETAVRRQFLGDRDEPLPSS